VLRLPDAVTAGKVLQGGAPLSAEPSPRHKATRHGSLAQSQLHSATSAAAAAAAAMPQQRVSDTGIASLSSPKPASWFEYIFPWQGTASAGNSPRHTQSGADSSGKAVAAIGAVAEGTAGGSGGLRLPSGAWASTAPGSDNGLGSPTKGSGHSALRRMAADARTPGVLLLVQGPCLCG
jgi:hypothetical protein